MPDNNDHHDEAHEAPALDHPAGLLWLLPKVTFGIQAAALASLVVPVGLVIGGVLGGGISDGVDAGGFTTCCPGRSE